MNATGLSVLLADDHFLIRRGLAQFLERHLTLERLQEADSADALLDAARSRTWDLVIVDYAMPGMDGMTTITRLHDLLPDSPIVIVSMLPEDQFALAALNAGASAYVGKHRPSETLLDALRAVLTGRRYMPSSVLEQPRASARPAGGVLSAQERKVLRLLGQGKKPQQIAADLQLSVKTVATYRTRIMEKLDLKNQAQLLRYAVTHGLFQ